LPAGFLAGRSTKGIAVESYLSPYTIQDRRKRVFAKAAVGSRRVLVAQLEPGYSGN
jgi:DNA-binding NarL/FixJ family response regulator